MCQFFIPFYEQMVSVLGLSRCSDFVTIDILQDSHVTVSHWRKENCPLEGGGPPAQCLEVFSVQFKLIINQLIDMEQLYLWGC